MRKQNRGDIPEKNSRHHNQRQKRQKEKHLPLLPKNIQKRQEKNA